MSARDLTEAVAVHRWAAIGAPAGHVAEHDGNRVRCACSWSARATALGPARAVHARHVDLVVLLAPAAAGGERAEERLT